MKFKTAVRRGDIDSKGAYFSTNGSSTYWTPEDPQCTCHDISQVRILDWREKGLAVELLRQTVQLCSDSNSTPRGMDNLRTELDAIESGEQPHIGYMLADETPMAQAGKAMG